MGRPKALVELGGATYLERAIALLTPLCDPVVVVLGYHRDEILESIGAAASVRVAINPDPARGMLSSLQCGLAAAACGEAGAVFTLVDCPAIRAATARRVVEEFIARGVEVAVPVFEGRRGHPVCVGPRVVAALLDEAASGRARDVIERYRTPASLVPVDDAGVVTDADEPADLAAIEALAR